VDYFRPEKIAAARKMFIAVIDSKISVDLVTCTIVLNGLCNSYHRDEAVKLFKELRARRVEEVKDLFSMLACACPFSARVYIPERASSPCFAGGTDKARPTRQVLPPER
jgi:pentatricopeptide repeat protein